MQRHAVVNQHIASEELSPFLHEFTKQINPS